MRWDLNLDPRDGDHTVAIRTALCFGPSRPRCRQMRILLLLFRILTLIFHFKLCIVFVGGRRKNIFAPDARYTSYAIGCADSLQINVPVCKHTKLV